MFDMNEYMGIIENRCQHWAAKTGLPLGELQELAKDNFSMVALAFDERKGTAFSTLLWIHLDNRFANHYRNTLRRGIQIGADSTDAVLESEDNALLATNLTPFRLMEVRDELANVSMDARTILKIIFDAPEDLGITGSEKGHAIKGMLWNYLKTRMGWKHHRVYAAMTELKTKVSML